MNLLHFKKDQRLVIAMLVAALFAVLFFRMMLPWVASLSQSWMQWLGAGVMVSMLFAMVVIVSIIQQPEKFQRFYNERIVERARRKGKHVHESRLSEDDSSHVRKKYPGLF